MIIDLDRKFLFIANLRTGSTSLQKALSADADIVIAKTRYGKHLGVAAIEERFRWIFQYRKAGEMFVFGVMRDPLDYLTSLYRFHKADAFRDQRHSTANINFDEFLETWVPTSWQTRPQIQRFLSPESAFETVTVWNFRNIERNFVLFRDRLGIDGALPHVNRSRASRAPIALSERRRAEIAEAYAADAALTRPEVLYSVIDPRSGAIREQTRIDA